MTATVVPHPSARRQKRKAPAVPAYITGLARDEWKRVAAVLADRGDLGPETLGALEIYCINYGRWRDAEAHVAEHGAVVAAPKTGVPMHSPHLTVANRASEMCLKLAKALRITCDTRPAANGKPPADSDPWEGLL
ncbi:phage terminase small subunit P27 family [Azospirillum sp. sgz301742]